MAIQILDQNTINKIAAGEVIERPSSVVKELVENAIDAKASAITVEIKDGGISFIRVTDNGCGIEKSELPLAFLRHSTSKIKSVEDLMCVKSLGFRGEALSSIAAVAQVELITKTKAALTGARYIIEGGEETAIEEIGAPDGTTFIVRNLFYNTPVRRKFLKTAATEGGYVASLIEHLAFSHPEISIRFISNNQNKLHTAGNGSLKDIIYHINGRDIAANLIEVSGRTQDIEVSGFIGKPVISRGNRLYENYFINGRYIKSNIITRAVEDAYKGHIMAHQYPFTVLHFTINQEIIDVNVHPTKMELRFSQKEYVYDFIFNAVKNALTQKELIPEVRIDNKKQEKSSASDAAVPKDAALHRQPRMPEPFEVQRQEQQRKELKSEEQQRKGLQSEGQQGKDRQDEERLQEGLQKEIQPPQEKHALQEQPAGRISEETPAYGKENADAGHKNTNAGQKSTDAGQDKAVSPEAGLQAQIEKNISINQQIALFAKNKDADCAARPKPKLIGQLFDTYWLIEFDEKLFIMDQHAAHEKILYEKTMRLLAEKRLDTQMIAPPIILSLSMREKEVLARNIEVFEKLGFEIEEFGGSEYKVTGTPASLPTLDDKALLMEILDSMVDENMTQNQELLTQKVASMSCKAAVKGNMKMSAAEAKQLIEQLMEADNPYNCPHGRPTLISMSKYELERKFKRIV